jgi:hypothetical protein
MRKDEKVIWLVVVMDQLEGSRRTYLYCGPVDREWMAFGEMRAPGAAIN